MTDRYVGTIEAKGWSLYDVGDDIKQRESWELREARRKPVTEVAEGGMYIFVPRPEPGQTLREAYATTMGVGPCLRIEDVDSAEYKVLGLGFSRSLAVFTRLAMRNSVVSNPGVALFTPRTPQLPSPDAVLLNPSTAEETFSRDFDVISPEEFRAEIARNQ